MHDFQVVGIGTSSSGYQDVKKILSHLPEKPGMSFFIIQHFTQHSSSMYAEHVGNSCKLQVIDADDNMPIEINKVYILPANRLFHFYHHTFSLHQVSQPIAQSHTFDLVFTHLAQAYENASIALLMSGEGTDGTLGIRKISEAGGTVIVQSPEEANFPEMAQIAISSGFADLILPTDQIAPRILDLGGNKEHTDVLKDAVDIISDKPFVHKIINLLSNYSDVDFESYKLKSIIRRIEKRIHLNKLNNLQAYYTFLQTNKHELLTLYKKSLIGVTEFFRDQEVFSSFSKHVIPKICKQKEPYEQVRIWVPACASGEEAYTIAILLEEYIQDHQLNLDFKIFATDLDENALEFASQGCYSVNAFNNLSEERIKRFFSKEEAFYCVNPSLRKRLLFVKHNLLKDPPFIHLDAISCRNLFIYLKPTAQKKITDIFHYALKADSFLLIGANEYLEEHHAGFKKVDSKNRIYSKEPTALKPQLVFDSIVNTPGRRFYKKHTAKEKHQLNIPPSEDDLGNLLLNTFVSKAILVNQKMELVYLHGDLRDYLKIPKHEMRTTIDKMLKPELVVVIENGIQKLKEGHAFFTIEDFPFYAGDKNIVTQIHFRLIKSDKTRSLYFCIEFGDIESKKNHSNLNEGVLHGKEKMDYISNLETELRIAKQELIAVSYELDANREALQASQEEMLSSNEELHSTNEELQSSNEELFSVNSELKRKLEELTTLNHDINNLFESTDIAILFLDQDINIRKFTPSVSKHFKIRAQDIGRPLTDLNKSFDDPDFEENLLHVLHTQQVFEKEIVNPSKENYQLRIIPYKKDKTRSSGLVITFVDITDLKQINIQLEMLSQHLKQSESSLQSLVNNTPDIIIRFDNQMNHLFENHSAKLFFPKVPDRYQNFDDYKSFLFDKKESKRLKEKFQQVISNKSGEDFFTTTFQMDKPIHFYVKLVAELNNDSNEVSSVLAIARDITLIKNTELKLQIKNDELIKINEYLDEFVYSLAHDLRAPVANLLSIVKLFESAESDKQAKLLHLLSKTVNKLDTTLNGLIDMIEAQENGSKKGEACIFKEILEDIKSELFTFINDNQARIEYSFDKVSDIHYNKTYLYSIMRNLLNNAIKYRSQKRTPVIKISTQKLDNSFVLLSIKDNGRGIDLQSNKKELFKPFKRFDKQTEGRGIGLHIIKNMIERNGGTIEVDSELEKGTTFKMLLKIY